jgi:hypothetical protein
MNIGMRFAGVMVVGLAALVASVGFGGGGSKAEAAGATISCSVPLDVVCDVTHPDGIANVTVLVDFGDLGVVDVVNKDYPTCPKDVTVSWDPIVPNATIVVTPCEGFGLLAGGHGDTGRFDLKARETTQRDGGVLASPYSGPNVLAANIFMSICNEDANGNVHIYKINKGMWNYYRTHGYGVPVNFGGQVLCIYPEG